MYVSQLDVSDIRNLYSLIKIYDPEDPSKRIHYKVISDTFIYNPKQLNPTQTLFIRDFSCSLPLTDREIVSQINETYRAYMSKRFPDYTANLKVYLDKKNSIENTSNM